MEHVAIVERQDLTWYVHIPELQLGTPVDEPSDAHDAAARLVAAAAGVSMGEVQVEVRLVRTGDVLVSTVPSPVRARHFDGVWHDGERGGWVRQPDRSWRALICYVVDGVRWERTMTVGQFRPLGSVGKVPGGGSRRPLGVPAQTIRSEGRARYRVPLDFELADRWAVGAAEVPDAPAVQLDPRRRLGGGAQMLPEKCQ